MTETVENAQSQSTETPKWLDSPFAAMFQQALDSGAIQSLADSHNALVAQLKAQGSEKDQINEVLNSSQDQNVVQWRQNTEERKNEQAQEDELIEKYIRENLLSKDSDFDAAAAEKSAKELADQYQKLVTGFKGLPGGPEFVESLPALNKLKGTGATGQRRSRWANIEIKDASNPNAEYERVFEMQAVKDDDGKTTGQKEVQTFTVLVRKYKELSGNKTDVATLYSHYDAEAAKTDGKSPVEFALGKFIVRATPSVED